MGVKPKTSQSLAYLSLVVYRIPIMDSPSMKCSANRVQEFCEPCFTIFSQNRETFLLFDIDMTSFT